MAEEFPEPTSLNVTQATDALMKQFETSQEEENQADPEAQEDEAVETEAEVQEDDTAEVETDDASDEMEAEPTAEELFIELDGEEVSLAQLKEWREGGLKASDYTQKTQALAEERRTVEAEKIAAQQEVQALRGERAKLQEALASLAIDSEQEPNWVELAAKLTPQQYQARQAAWNQKQAQKQKAQQAYQALQAQQIQEQQQREIANLLHHRPQWSDPVVRDKAIEAMSGAVAHLGISPDDVLSMPDHRMFLILDELVSLKAQVAKVEEAKNAVSKRVVKAEPRRSPQAKSSKADVESKAQKQRAAKFRKTRNINDATDMIMAALNKS